VGNASTIVAKLGYCRCAFPFAQLLWINHQIVGRLNSMFSVPIFCLLVFLTALSAYVINQIPALKNFPGRNVTIYRVLAEATALTVCLMALNDENLAKKYLWAEKGAWISGVLLGFDILQLGWAIWKHAQGDVSAANYDDSRQRQLLLDCVDQDIKRRIKANLRGLAVMPLEMRSMPDRVGQAEMVVPVNVPPAEKPKKSWLAPIQRILRRKDRVAMEIPQSRKMIDVFVEADRRLLILGKPGAGKTTLLLELAEQLLAAAQVPESNQIPVRLECSKWKDSKQSLAQWLVAQLKDEYKVPIQLSQRWLDNKQIIPLLDGLDELGLERQRQATLAIAAFISDYHYPTLAVCCRQEEFDQAGEILDGLQGAVYLEPLKDQQICDYLWLVGRPEVWEKIQSTELRDMLPDWESCLQTNELPGLRSPLLLNMLLITEPKQPIRNAEELCAAYLNNQLQQRSTISAPGRLRYTPEQTRRYLQWLARQLKAEKTTEFRIEHLQPTWLAKKYQLWLYRLTYGLTYGLTLGLTLGIFFGLTSGIIYGLISGLTYGLSGFNESISTTERFDFSIKGFRQGIKQSLIHGLFHGLFSGLIGGLIHGHFVGLITGIFYGLFSGLIGGLIHGLINNDILAKSDTNQGIKDTAKNAVLIATISFSTVGLFFAMQRIVVGQPAIIENFLYYGFGGSLLIGFFAGGGIDVIHHGILRLSLWGFGYSPWNYAQFMEHANQLRLVQNLGGSYRFIHDVLREQIIDQAPIPVRSTPWPEWIKYTIISCGMILAVLAGRGLQPIDSQIVKTTGSIFQSGDWVFYDSTSYRFTSPKRGDWITSFMPSYKTRQFKQIIGIPGETVSDSHGKILINGQPIEQLGGQLLPKFETSEPFQLSPNSYYVVGKKVNPQGKVIHIAFVVDRKDIDTKCAGRIWPPHRFGAIN
jgi:DNA polymerase III delta prime subunit